MKPNYRQLATPAAEPGAASRCKGDALVVGGPYRLAIHEPASQKRSPVNQGVLVIIPREPGCSIG
jgi:hypothetical protein